MRIIFQNFGKPKFSRIDAGSARVSPGPGEVLPRLIFPDPASDKFFWPRPRWVSAHAIFFGPRPQWGRARPGETPQGAVVAGALPRPPADTD